MILRRFSFSLILIFLFVSACGVSRTASKKSDSRPGAFIEDGVASWYGPKFHGKLTANGEVYDMDGLTAAHRTLPFNTVVRVENLDSGKSVVVRINDRGPFAKNRIIDLSREAAKRVEMIGPGTARVKLHLVEGDIANSRTTDLKNANYTVQLGSFRERKDALRLSNKINGSRVESVWVKNDRYYRVYFGSYKDPVLAKEEQEKLRRKGYDGFVKQIEND